METARRAVRVILAEDSAIIRERLTELLGETECIELVGTASDAPGARALFAAARPDAVILDIQMPGGSGIDVLDTIRRSDQTCVVIMLTNFNSPDYRRRCLDGGANFFLDKTTEFEQVVDVLRAIDRGRS